MLTSDQLDALSEPLTALYEEYNQSVINDIARRLADLNFDSAAWQMQRITESGMVYKNALQELAKLTGKSDKELREIFKRAGVMALKFDDAIYKAAGLPLPLTFSPAMSQVLAAGLRKTQGVLSNLTLTTAINGQQNFIKAADMAYMQVVHGTMSYDEAIRAAVKQVANEGLSVIHYASGRRDQLDVAMRRTVLTGVSQTTGHLQTARADEMGVDLVQVSAHIGARPSHQEWQGKIFSRSGKHAKYPDFESSTGYGTAGGLMGANCRHSFYPFFEGISENAYKKSELESYANKTVTFNGQKISVYEATQVQRGMERKIRFWKRQADALDAAGLENAGELAKVKNWQGKTREFIRQTGLQRQGAREGIIAPPKTVGFSFLSGDTRLSSTLEARKLGNSSEGWEKYKKIFAEKYLKRFGLRDKIESTIGLWDGPEPSFNAWVRGKREKVLEMAKAWGREKRQQGMALLFPNPKGDGGKLIWDFLKPAADNELDILLGSLNEVRKAYEKATGDYFPLGVTIRDGELSMEYWYKDEKSMKIAQVLIEEALNKAALRTEFRQKGGYDFELLLDGVDYFIGDGGV